MVRLIRSDRDTMQMLGTLWIGLPLIKAILEPY